jgi:hypothetical protein
MNEQVQLDDSARVSAHPYARQCGVLATMHGKEVVIAPALRDGLGLVVEVAPDLDTDALGTFTGEIPRAGSIREAAIAKARLGMAATRRPIGIASEGSYGPHPWIPFVAGGIEMMVLVDDTREIIITESLVDDGPVYAHAEVTSADELGTFLDRIHFPQYALIVKPNASMTPAFPMHKGLRCRQALAHAVTACAACSSDGQAFVQTDMRAHMNPTRMAAIDSLARKLCARAATCCPCCNMPGYGQVDIEAGLPCEWCGLPTPLVHHEIFGCVACEHRERRPRPDGRSHAAPGDCPHCNP